MRPLRSFLLLLIFLVCFTGLYYIIPYNRFFPSIYEFIPEKVITSVLHSVDNQLSKEISKPEGSAPVIDSASIIPSDSAFSKVRQDPTEALGSFLDSLSHVKEQVRIMYYGDSQIEGDRITSYLRKTLRISYGGTGPGLFLPVMPVMYTKTIWLKSSSNWKRFNYLSYKSGEIAHNKLGPFMAFCRFYLRVQN